MRGDKSTIDGPVNFYKLYLNLRYLLENLRLNLNSKFKKKKKGGGETPFRRVIHYAISCKHGVSEFKIFLRRLTQSEK